MIPPIASGRRSGAANTRLTDPSHPGLLRATSRDPDAKLTFVTTGDDGQVPDRGLPSSAVVKIPTTGPAAEAVEHEGRLLVELRRMNLGTPARAIPRYLRTLDVDDRQVLVSTVVPGRSMGIAYHEWMHTARRSHVRGDFDAAAAWLGEFQTASARPAGPMDWPELVLTQVCGRWDGQEMLPAAADRLSLAWSRLAPYPAPVTAVHGDFWFGNLLTTNGAVTGVVDWEAGAAGGCPLRDLARFVLSYSLYLDRHTAHGRRVLGHPGLRRDGFGAGVTYALLSGSWFSRLLRSFLGSGLERLGLPPSLWYDVALVGLGEVAASANDHEFGLGHLDLLSRLPAHPRHHRR